MVLREKKAPRPRTPQQQAELQKLIDWMIAHGVDFDKAQADLDRWRSRPHFDAEKERQWRFSREARERAAKKEITDKRAAEQ